MRLIRLAKIGDKLHRKMISQGIPEEIANYVSDERNLFPAGYRKFVASYLLDELAKANLRSPMSFEAFLKEYHDNVMAVRNWLRFAKEDDGTDLNMHKYKNWIDMTGAARAWESSMSDKYKEEGHPALYKDDDAEHTLVELPEGWRWVRISPQDCYNEGKSMQHCVWGPSYINGVSDRTKVLYSLRDQQGQPHVTVEAAISYSDRYIEAHKRANGMFNSLPSLKFRNDESFDVHNRNFTLGRAITEDQAREVLSQALTPIVGPEKTAVIVPEMINRAKLSHEVTSTGLTAADFIDPDILNDRRITQIYGKQNQPPIAKYSPYIKQLFKSLPEGTEIPSYMIDQYLDPEEVLEAFENGNMSLEDASQKLKGTPQFERIAELLRPAAIQRFMQGNATPFMDIVEAEGWGSQIVEDALTAIQNADGVEDLPIGGFSNAPSETMDRLAYLMAQRAMRRIQAGLTLDRDANFFEREYASPLNLFSQTVYKATAEMFAAGEINVEKVFMVLRAIEYFGEMGKKVLMLNPQKVIEYVEDKKDPFKDRNTIRMISEIVGGDPEFMNVVLSSLIAEYKKRIKAGEISPGAAAIEMGNNSIPPAKILDALGSQAYTIFRQWFSQGHKSDSLQRLILGYGEFRDAVAGSPYENLLEQAAIDAAKAGDLPLYDLYGKLSNYGFPGEFKARVLLENEEALVYELEKGYLSLKGLKKEAADSEQLMKLFLKVKNIVLDDLAVGKADFQGISWSLEDPEDFEEVGVRRMAVLSQLAKEDPEEFDKALKSKDGTWTNELACREALTKPGDPLATEFIRANLAHPLGTYNLFWVLDHQMPPETTLYDFLPKEEVTNYIFKQLSNGPDPSMTSGEKHGFYSKLISQLPPGLIKSPELRPLLKNLMARYPSSAGLSDLISQTAIGQDLSPEDMAASINSMFSKMRTQNPSEHQITWLTNNMMALAKEDPDRFYAIIPLLSPHAAYFLKHSWHNAMERSRVLPSEVGYINPPNDPEAEERFVQRIEKKFDEVPTEKDLAKQKMRNPQYRMFGSVINMLEGLGMHRYADRLESLVFN